MKMLKTVFVAMWVGGSSLMAAEPQMVSLFNGKDLTGWLKTEGYSVENETIVCGPKGVFMMTEKAYENYIFEFEFKCEPGANNGLGIHYPGNGVPSGTGMEIQILEDSHPKYKDIQPYQFHGSLYSMVPAKRGFLKPIGEWNHERVTVNGPLVKVELNGTVIVEANLDELMAKYPKHEGVKRRSGHLAWCGHGPGVSFRALKIAELPVTSAPK